MGTILLLGLLLIVFIRSALTQKLILEIQEKGIYIAKHLADASVGPLLKDQTGNLQLMIDELTSDSDVEYVFIRDTHEGIPASTFKDGFPADLKDINIPDSSQEYGMKSYKSEGVNMYDIAVPIMKGELGTVHVGISEAFIRGSVADIISLILEIVAGILVLGTVAAIIFARRVTKPLSELVETSKKIGGGNFDIKVIVRTDDELGQLGLTFNTMVDHLKDTTVSRDELKRSYEFTKTVLNSMNDSVSIIDVGTFRIIGVNTIFLKEFGVEEAEVIGKTCYEVTHKQLHPCAPPHDICPLMETMNTGKYSHAEHRHYTKDGDIRYVEVSTSPIFDNSGRLIQVVHVSNDVTDRKMIEERLLAEGDRAQNYLDIAGVMLLAIDADRKVTLINKKGCDILGHEESDVVGKNWFDNFIPERSRDEAKAAFDRLMTGEMTSAGYFENFVLTHYGTEKIIAWQNTILRDHRGNVIGTLSSGEDITKRRQAEAEVARNQEELINNHEALNKLFRAVEIANKEQQKIMDSLGDIIILTDDEGKIKRINSAIRKFTDKPYHEILDHIWEELIYENELEATTLYEGRTELLHKPSQKWFELQAYPFEYVELGFSGNVITIHETTEIKKITEELENYSKRTNEDRMKLQNALDQISALMQNVARQTDTSIRLTSDNLKKCYEVKNCSTKDCACYGKGPMRCWQVAGTFCGGKVQGSFAHKYNNCSGCEVFKEATQDPFYQIGEHFNNMMHVLEVKSRELEDAYSELKNTQAQILQREKMASIGQLAAGVAHEINNPTGFIMSNLGTLGKYVDKLTEYINAQSLALESIKAEELSAGLKETRKKLKLDYVIGDVGQLIQESIDGAERIKKIVQNLKNFSRVDQAEYKAADINECIESTLNIVWNELKYKTTVEKEYGSLPLIKCYPQQLNQIFMNLLVNAAQAIEKQGTIKIKTWNGNGDGTVNISISDTGSGIPEDKLDKIFDPFFTTKPVGKGTGLGLSIVYDIVKKHKGDIRVESTVGSGTAFTIKIPVVEEPQH